MQMVRLIYVSVMTDACDTEALEEILRGSRENNNKKEITGMLCYDPAFFLQCLEGPREAVNELYATIAADGRHKNVTILEYTDVEERLFANWCMAFVSASTIKKEILDNFSKGKGNFNPFALNGSDAQQFLATVAAEKCGCLASQ